MIKVLTEIHLSMQNHFSDSRTLKPSTQPIRITEVFLMSLDSMFQMTNNIWNTSVILIGCVKYVKVYVKNWFCILG